jgi:hypothetical protein
MSVIFFLKLYMPFQENTFEIFEIFEILYRKYHKRFLKNSFLRKYHTKCIQEILKNSKLKKSGKRFRNITLQVPFEGSKVSEKEMVRRDIERGSTGFERASINPGGPVFIEHRGRTLTTLPYDIVNVRSLYARGMATGGVVYPCRHLRPPTPF